MPIFSLNEVRTEQVKNIANDNFESWPESATYGYFGGGDDGTDLSTINRLDYQVEVVSDPGSSKISVSARNGGSVQTSLYGFYVGGRSFASKPNSEQKYGADVQFDADDGEALHLG